MNFFKVHIGLRTFKTGLAVMLVMIAYHFIDRPAFVPALAAVFALRDTWDNTMTFAKVRLISNAVGGGLAIIYYLFREYTHNADWISIVLIPILVMAGIIIHNKLDQSVGIVGVLFAIAINRFAMPDEIKKVESEVVKVEQSAKKVIKKIEHKNDKN